MSDESDFDDDIDKLLDEIDTAGPKKPKQPTTPAAAIDTKVTDPPAPPANSEPKITLKSDGNGLNVNYGGGSGFKLSDLSRPSLGVPPPLTTTATSSQQFGKSVRFPEEPPNTSSAPANQSAGPKPNFLSNLLGNNQDQNSAATQQTSSEPRIPAATSTIIAAAAAKSALQSSKSDWLGLGPGSGETSLSPVHTPGLGRRPLGDRQMASRNQDNDEMLRSMGFDPKDAALQQRSSAPTNASASGPRSTLKAPKSSGGGFDLDDDFWPSASRPSTGQPGIQAASTETSFRNTLLQKSSLNKSDPFASTLANEAPKQHQGSKSIVDVLPFLGKSKEDTPDASLEPVQSQQAPQPPPPRSVKVVKKVAARSASPGNFLDRPTLQLPTHLVDEDELKSVCNSLKSLYTTQLDMQEKSYQDQMDCLLQSHQRKEQMLREEIRTMQKEYEGRIERLKSELSETETKMPQRFHSEMEAIQKMHQQLLRTSSLAEEATSGPSSTKNLAELQKLLETHLDHVASKIVGVISKTQLETTAVRHQEAKALEARMDSMQKKLEAFARLKLDEETFKNTALIDTERKIKDELSKLTKSHKKLRQDVVKSAVSAIGQTLQALNGEESHKKEKMSSQLKEFRKDVRRVLYDLEAKSDSTQRSFTAVDSSHKEILKTLNHLEAQMHGFRSSSVPQDRWSNETEFETRLLREERTSLSESIAQMNVEKRKLNEEKVSVQQDRIELDRERNKLRDYEVQLRVKIAEAEDMKKQAEEVRRTETAKSLEAASKLSQVEHERSAQRRQVQEIEQQLRLREAKLIQDKTELMREKEFLEKLRDQLMCPGCLKSISSSIRHITGLSKRSDGDGIEGSLGSPPGGAEEGGNLKFLQLPNFVMEETPSFSTRAFKDGLYLDDLYYKQFFK